MNTLVKLKAAHAASTPKRWGVKLMYNDDQYGVFSSNDGRDWGNSDARYVCTTWDYGCDHRTQGVNDANFIALAHNAMPALVQMAELAWDLAHLCCESDFADDRKAEKIRRKILDLYLKELK
jgi:hypothetical protein